MLQEDTISTIESNPDHHQHHQGTFMPRRTLTNYSDKDDLSEEGTPTLPILTRAQHRRFIEEQRTIISTLIRDFSPDREVFYAILDTPKIVHKDALEDILGVQHVERSLLRILYSEPSRRKRYTYSRGARQYSGRPTSIRLGQQRDSD